MDEREILLTLRLAHENLLKREYKNGRIQIGILIGVLEKDGVKNNVGLGSVSNSVCKHEDKHIESIMGEGVLCNKCNTVIKN